MRLAFWRKADGVQGQQGAQAVAQPAQGAQAQKANQAAQAALGQIQQPSKASKAWTWTKDNAPRIAYTVMLAAAAVLLGIGIPAGALSALAIAGYSVAGAALIGAAVYEVKQARNLDVHAKELYKAVKAFDDINPASNRYLTAQERYSRAQTKIRDDLIRMNPADRNAFVKRVASAANSDPHFRISTEDGRYGLQIEGKPRGATFTEFVGSLVNSHAEDIQAAYNEEITSYSETFTNVLKDDNVQNCKQLRHEINRVAYKMSGKKEYRMLGKSTDDVIQDLHAAVTEKFGARNIRRDISRLEGLMADRYGFWSDVEKVRKGIRKDFDKRYKAIDKEIDTLGKEIKDLKDAERGLAKKKETHLDYARDLNNSRENLEGSRLEVVLIDARLAEIKAEKTEKRQVIDQLKNEQAILEGRVGYDHLMNLNAKRRELGKVLGQDLDDLELPGHPTFGDKVKYWAPRAAIAGAAVAGAVYGYPYYSPYVAAPYAAKAGAAATGAWASVKGWLFGKDQGGPFPAQHPASLARQNLKYEDFASYPSGDAYAKFLGLKRPDQGPFPAQDPVSLARENLSKADFASYPSGNAYAEFLGLKA